MVNSLNPWCPMACFKISARARGFGAFGSSFGCGFSIIKNANGIMMTVIAVKMYKVVLQLKELINCIVAGSIANCPKDPMDIESPKAILLFSTGTDRLITPKTTGAVVPARPIPIRIPADQISAMEVWALDIRYSPAA